MVAQCLPFRRPATSTEAQFSLPFAVGAMLVFGELTPKQLDSETLADPGLRRAMEQVTMTLDPALAASEADRRDRPEASIVTISTTDGRKCVRRIDAATCMPTNPMPDAMLDASANVANGRALRMYSSPSFGTAPSHLDSTRSSPSLTPPVRN
jgi:2-methylcitrate dehydratase PrpD